MKRRRFIQATLITGAATPVAGLSSERLYGTPGSLLPNGGSQLQKFTVPLVRLGAPPAAWNDFAGIASAIEGVMTDPREAAEFSNHPKAYLISKGLDGSDKTLMDDSTIMLTCLMDGGVRDSIAEGRYDDALSCFEAAGLFQPRDPSQLAVRMQEVMQKNIAEIREMIASKANSLDTDQEKLLLDVLRESGAHVTEDDLLIVAEVMRSTTISPMVLVPVLVVAVIVALAAVYISIAVGVTVGLAAAITVSIALHLAVVASGDKQRSHGNPDKRVAFDGSMARLDPDLMKNSERAIRMAKVMGDPQLEIHVMKRTIREEVSAFMTALSNTGILKMDERQLELSVEATTAYSYRVIGV